MHTTHHDNIFDNKCKKSINSDQETITVNRSKLIDDILNLLIVVFITGISIGTTITWLIM